MLQLHTQSTRQFLHWYKQWCVRKIEQKLVREKVNEEAEEKNYFKHLSLSLSLSQSIYLYVMSSQWVDCMILAKFSAFIKLYKNLISIMCKLYYRRFVFAFFFSIRILCLSFYLSLSFTFIRLICTVCMDCANEQLGCLVVEKNIELSKNERQQCKHKRACTFE